MITGVCMGSTPASVLELHPGFCLMALEKTGIVSHSGSGIATKGNAKGMFAAFASFGLLQIYSSWFAWVVGREVEKWRGSTRFRTRKYHLFHASWGFGGVQLVEMGVRGAGWGVQIL